MRTPENGSPWQHQVLRAALFRLRPQDFGELRHHDGNPIDRLR
ncbi:hypothetical protein OG500_06410 [Kitasatospora sp. NBC_01250]|nr:MULTISPECIES: hypothetical protein [unclassified Kitasatospora]WSJ65748.1 hypothetical protein OG294_06285 [Kitasatospora sp. NBC_01302]